MQKEKELGIETLRGMRIINAQSPDHQYIRSSMLPTMLAFLKENRAYSETFGIFEIGHTVEGLRADGYCNEKKKLGVVLFSKSVGEECLFERACNMVKELTADILHKDAEIVSAECAFDFVHPVNSFDILIDGKRVGYLGVPHPTVLENIDKKCAVSFFEICTEDFALVKADNIKYVEPSKFPAIDIDLTFVADIASVSLTAVKSVAKATAGALLSDVKFKDIYVGEDGVNALTLRFSFVSNERTLNKQELTPVVDAITAALADNGLTIKA
jgi:phenylalanyl-tRNA synthetase beta chain